MKFRTHFILAAFGLLLAGLAVTARGQTTIWLPTSPPATADYWASGNWNNGLPDITLFHEGTFENDFTDYVSQSAYISTDSTAVVTATNATANQLFVGNGGSTSTLRVESGGILTLNGLTLGADSSSTGDATVSGTGSTLTGGTLYVGDSGTGSLRIENGGTLAMNFATRVGRLAGSEGTLVVTGTDSTVNGHIGTSAGTAHITITDNAIVTGEISGSNASTGTADFTISDNASVWGGFHGGVGSGTSTLTISNYASLGGFTGGTSDDRSHSTNTVTVSDNGILSDHINSGDYASSDITFTTGGTFSSGSINLHTAGTASVTFDGGNHTADGGITVGGTGTNTLTIQNGASLGDGDSGADLLIGNDSGTSGTVTVKGSGSSWTSLGTLYLGASGTGTLNIQDGASATLPQIYVGSNADGFGTINLTTGGTLNASDVSIGSSPGGSGQVTIDGSGSTLHVTSGFIIGDSGNGNITISNGGTLTNDAGASVGASGNGSVTITGEESSWTSGSSITMGGNGVSGSITLNNGGQLTINGDGHLTLNSAGGFGTLTIGAEGGLPLAPGTLNAMAVSGAGNAGGGSAVLFFNHNQTATPYSFTPVITGGVTVIHKAGTTVLTGANDYTGGTTIMGGTLALGANNALGIGDIIFDGGTLDLSTSNQTSGLLNVLGNSFVDFSGTNTLVFADSSGITWSGTLTVLNFGGGDVFQVGVDGTGLTADQLALIDIDGFIAQIDGSGLISMSNTAFVAPAVPEPSTYAALAGLAALGFAAYRRRRVAAIRLNL